MFNNVDGNGFSNAAKEAKKLIKELKPLFWFLAIALVTLLFYKEYNSSKQLELQHPDSLGGSRNNSEKLPLRTTSKNITEDFTC